MVQYPVPDSLYASSVQHCAALAITQDVITGPGWPQFAQPDKALRNGTLLFVKSEGKTYAITCWHVVDHYRRVLAASGNQASHSMRTMINGFYVVQDRFIRPAAQFGDDPPDIAIRELNENHVMHLGKAAIDLDWVPQLPDVIDHAYAVGFPEQLKYHKDDGALHYRVAMPHVEILAELPGLPTRRFAMSCKVGQPAQNIDYSGMSGGPIFWTTTDAYGLLGIIYEGGASKETDSVFVYGELATPDVIRGWIAQCASFK